MKKKIFDQLTKLEHQNGKLKGGFIALSRQAMSLSVGGSTTNGKDCSGTTNSSCTNSGNCSGTSNTGCTNSAGGTCLLDSSFPDLNF